MMKLLHIISGLGNGGAEAVLWRLVAHDRYSGNQHVVISLTDRGVYADRLEQIGVVVHTLSFSRRNLGSVLKLFKLLRQIRPDVVQTWMYHADLLGGVIARLSGIRAIAWGIRHGNLDPAHNRKTTLRIARLCARLSVVVPRKIVSCSIEATRSHQAIGYQVQKFVQIPNGYNLDNFRPDAISRATVRSELGISEDTFVLGMVARFDAQKDHRNLISALAKLKHAGVKFYCLFVGPGMDKSNTLLMHWIGEVGISESIKLLGERGDVPAVMNALDVHALSSLGEAFPNVLAEAMACGTPCISTDVGDARVIIADCGWVVPPRDVDALADGLINAHADFEMHGAAWQTRRAACRSHITANFGLEQMCERYQNVWRTCAAG